MTDDAQWEVFLCDEDGFTERDDEKALALLRMLPDEAAIEREYGDCIPDTITVCRGEAKPKPQSPGSDFLRQPGTRRMVDFLDIELRDENDPDRAVLLWVAAKGAAKALNEENA